MPLTSIIVDMKPKSRPLLLSRALATTYQHKYVSNAMMCLIISLSTLFVSERQMLVASPCALQVLKL